MSEETGPMVWTERMVCEFGRALARMFTTRAEAESAVEAALADFRESDREHRARMRAKQTAGVIVSEKIRPALTPEQWATEHLWIQAETYDSDHNAAAEIRFSPGQFRLLDHESNIFGVFDTPKMQHAVMALGNHALPDGDPRKITRADVHACADASMFDGPHPALARLALKLAALLRPESAPPRDPPTPRPRP